MQLRHPLDCNHARKLISHILTHGEVHLDVAQFQDEALADGLDSSDALNVLRGGTIFEPPEERHAGVWRYRVHTPKMCVVVHFDAEDALTVVPIWRKKKT